MMELSEELIDLLRHHDLIDTAPGACTSWSAMGAASFPRVWGEVTRAGGLRRDQFPVHRELRISRGDPRADALQVTGADLIEVTVGAMEGWKAAWTIALVPPPPGSHLWLGASHHMTREADDGE